MRQSPYATTALVSMKFHLSVGKGTRTPNAFSRTAAFQERFLVQPDYLRICAATVLISTLSECEPVIISLLVEFEPLTMGDKPVSNNTYETSMLNKIGIMEALYPDLVPPQDLLAAIKICVRYHKQVLPPTCQWDAQRGFYNFSLLIKTKGCIEVVCLVRLAVSLRLCP